uniref:Mitochondrial glutathione transporter SLC25A39 n=1 Tax=Astyanax mexicanus TaxID=7994 RepID=A0A8B9R434_ASTMX
MSEGPAVSPSAAITPVQQMLASGTGALLTSIFVTPLDVVKIRLQAQQSPFYHGTLTYCNRCHIYTCLYLFYFVDAFVKITRHEGLRSLWSGLPPTLVMAVPATVIYFTCYDQLRDFLRFRMGYQGNHVPLIAGGLARRELMIFVLCFLLDTKFKLCLGIDGGDCLSSNQTVLCPLQIAAILTLPFDVVKTRRQIQLGEMESLGASMKKPSSTLHIMKSIWSEMGYRGLFAGKLWKDYRVNKKVFWPVHTLHRVEQA